MPLHFHEYRLAGFICHIGWYQHSGHYVFYLHEDSFEDRWIRFDDSRVTELQYGIDEIFWQGFCSNETPLIAFYRKAATG
jgi:ubiquitin C-terminal hydrolase